jgi:predicted nucleic acid-binding protein
MELVVDFNVIFSALVSDGVSSEIFALNRKSRRLWLIAPEFLLGECSNNRNRLLSLSSLSAPELDRALSLITSQISIIPFEEFKGKIADAKKLDPKDSPYIALALKRKCPILSGDKRLHSLKEVKVWSPRDALNMLEA